LEWQAWKATLCSGCGLPRHETMTPAAEFLFAAEPVRCHACAARERKAKVVHGDEHADTAGLYFVVEREGDG